MSVVDELADALAKDAIEAADRLGDEALINDMARILGDTSSTSQEAFLTSVRVRQATSRARRFLEDRIARG